MHLLRTPLLLAALACCVAPAHAQTARPATHEATAQAAPLTAVERVELPAVDNDALLARDAARANPAAPRPLQFAEPFDLALRPATHGTWETLRDGRRVWRLRVGSPGAYSLNVGFSRFRLPDGAALWLYGAGAEPAFRAFTAADNEAHGELWTPVVPGDEMVIELALPATKGEPDFELEVLRVNHAYRPFGLDRTTLSPEDVGRSGSCNVDVVCPQGDGYRDIIRSSGAYTRSGIDICSGAAINNTAEDGSPYFLTANHCGNSSGNAASVVIYWNYENSTCRAPGSPASGGPGDGPLTMFNSGTIFRGSSNGSDWALLETDDPIDPNYNVFFSGWDRRDQATPSAVAIHHPGVEEKRISFEDDPTSITNYLSANPNANGSHIRVADWDLGTTEPGSSGSPLYSPEKRIVGQLHGGYASCSSQTADWYGRMARSMNTGLAQWLDPLATGAPTLDGQEAGTGAFGTFAAAPASTTPGATVRLTATLTNATGEALNGVSFEDDLVAGLTYAGNPSSSTGSVSHSGGTVTWAFDVADGATETVSYDVAVGPDVDTDLLNLATFDHPSLDNTVTVSAAIDVFVEADLIYTNEQDVSIPDNACPANVTSAISVPDSFAWNQLKVGVMISHTYRGDLRIELESPEGTTVRLLQRVGGTANNLDALFSDEGPAGAFGSGSHALGLPNYEVEGQPQGSGTAPLSSFASEDPQGAWTLKICDDAGIDTGSLVQWSLLFYTPGSMGGDLSVAVTPASAPVVIAPGGGTLSFTAELMNDGAATESFDAWTLAELPDGSTFGPLVGPVAVSLDAGASLTRSLSQSVPANAPAGDYRYVAYVGTYPDGAVASDDFAFTKTAAGTPGVASSGSSARATWTARYAGTGSPVEVGDRWTGQATPPALSAAGAEGFEVAAVYPNPMRERAAVGIRLGEAEVVTVSVFDLLGRRIAVLHDGELPAGETLLGFSNAGLADGTYLVRVEAASGVMTRRVTVLR